MHGQRHTGTGQRDSSGLINASGSNDLEKTTQPQAAVTERLSSSGQPLSGIQLRLEDAFGSYVYR